MSLNVLSDSHSQKYNFLLDTGAEISILDSSIVAKFNSSLYPVTKNITSFSGKSQVNGATAPLRVVLPGGNNIPVNFFAMPGAKMEIFHPQLEATMCYLKDNNVNISPSFPPINSNCVQLAGILGNDVIQQLKTFQTVTFQNGKLLQVADGFIPIGSPGKLMNVPLSSGGVELTKESEAKLGCLEAAEHLSSALISAESNHPASAHHNGFNHISTEATFVDGSAYPGERSTPVARTKRKPKPFSPVEVRQSVNFVLNPNPSYFSPIEKVFPDSNVEQGLEHIFSLESLGISKDVSTYDQQQVEKFEKSILFQDGHYQVELPWKEELIDKVPSNYPLAKVIAKKVYEKNNKQGIATQYLNVFEEQEKLGIIEQIPAEFDPEEHVWIPNRPVIRDDPLATTHVRPVFNCSLKTRGAPSLNEAAYPGTDLMGDLLGLLNYFRTNKYTLLADIVKAFLMVKLKNLKDRNRFSFLLYKDGKYIPYRYNTIIFGFCSSPFILNYILRHHATRSNDPDIRDAIASKFYMDNFIYTSSSKKELIHCYDEIKSDLEKGGFNLRDWVSNSKEVMSHIPEPDQCDSDLTKVLGYNYDPQKDILTIKNTYLDDKADTKRKILSSISSIFDPIGVLAPLTVRGKFIMRQITEVKCSWDEQLPDSILVGWRKLCEDFATLKSFSFPRRTVSDDCPAEMFIFCDASSKAYGFSAYVVQKGQSNLFFSKCKVAPLERKTLPSLELLATYMALKCISNLLFDKNLSNINISKINLFTDSQVALSWLFTKKATKKNVFVNNRLKEIVMFLEVFAKQEVPVNFHYVPTDENIADIISRGVAVKDFCENKKTWICGPEWILESNTSWPTGQLGCIPTQFIQTEPSLVAPLIASVPLIEFSKYSSYKLLFGVTCKLFEVANKCKKVTNEVADVKTKAFNYLIKQMQSCHFAPEIECLTSKGNMARPVPPLIQQLNLFLDENGIMRSRGRVAKNISLDFNAINPIVCHKDSWLTKLIIRDTHEKCKHMGANATINALRQGGFWIPRVRQAVFTELKTCRQCKVINAKAFKYPSPTALPSDRVNLVRPFNTIGIDFTGHFFTIDKRDVESKQYILIITCMNTRAVHLEVLPNMTAPEFVMAFIRFTNRYGIPKVVYTDNAKYFIAAAGILSKLLLSSEFEEKFRTCNIAFRNIPTYAAWYGATWERLIKLVKDAIYKTFGKGKLAHSNFLTTVTDIQLVINNRPLTYRTKEGELDILTPNHLIQPGNAFPSLVISEEASKMIWEMETEDFREDLFSSLEARDALQAKFREIWGKDYLLSLREAHKNSQVSPKIHPYLKVGSIVLIKNPFKSRVYWTMVRITEIIPSYDGQIRAVKIMRPDRSITKAAVCNLYPLELEAISVPLQESLASEPEARTDTEPGGLTEEIENEGATPYDDINNDQMEDFDLVEQNELDETDDSNRDSVVQSAPILEQNSSASLRPRRNAAYKCNNKLKEIFNAEDM